MIEIKTLNLGENVLGCVYFVSPKFYPKIYHGFYPIFYPKFFPTFYRIVALTFSEISYIVS